VAQLGARLDGIEEVVGSNPIGSTKHSHAVLFYILQSQLSLRLVADHFGYRFTRTRTPRDCYG
jgi:hypothetical protein